MIQNNQYLIIIDDVNREYVENVVIVMATSKENALEKLEEVTHILYMEEFVNIYNIKDLKDFAYIANSYLIEIFKKKG